MKKGAIALIPLLVVVIGGLLLFGTSQGQAIVGSALDGLERAFENVYTTTGVNQVCEQYGPFTTLEDAEQGLENYILNYGDGNRALFNDLETFCTGIAQSWSGCPAGDKERVVSSEYWNSASGTGAWIECLSTCDIDGSGASGKVLFNVWWGDNAEVVTENGFTNAFASYNGQGKSATSRSAWTFRDRCPA